MDSLLSIDFSIYVWVAVGIAAIAACCLPVYYGRMLGRVARRCKDDAEGVAAGVLDSIPSEAWPAVSVIVCVNGETTELNDMLPMVLEQDYPGPMEVIVVNDGEREAVECYISALELNYRNLYLTFTPANSRNLSRRKLSLMIGIKAARYDNVLITSAACRPVSPLWLRAMMRHIAMGSDIVIGHTIDVATDNAPAVSLSRAASMDVVLSDSMRLSRALRGKPYRADGNNLGYRKEVFTANRGFSSHLNLKWGDDDIFLQQIARNRRTAVELSPESMLKSLTDDLTATHAYDRMRYDFTGRFVRTSARRCSAFAAAGWWLWLAASAVAIALGLPSLIPAAAVTLIALGLCIPVMASYRRTARLLYERPLMLTVPWLMLWRPFYNLYYSVRERRNRDKNFTWTSDRFF